MYYLPYMYIANAGPPACDFKFHLLLTTNSSSVVLCLTSLLEHACFCVLPSALGNPDYAQNMIAQIYVLEMLLKINAFW